MSETEQAVNTPSIGRRSKKTSGGHKDADNSLDTISDDKPPPPADDDDGSDDNDDDEMARNYEGRDEEDVVIVGDFVSLQPTDEADGNAAEE